MSLAIAPGRIEEITTQLDRAMQGFQRLFIIRASPPRQPPHAIPNVADLPSGSSKCSILHLLAPLPVVTTLVVQTKATKVATTFVNLYSSCFQPSNRSALLELKKLLLPLKSPRTG